MATNADDIMNKHFEAAGIPADDKSNEDNTNGNDDSSQQGEEQDTGAEGGEGEANKEGNQQQGDEGDRSGSGKDGKSEQRTEGKGKEKEGQARDPNGKQGKPRVNPEADRWRDQYNVETQRRKGLDNELKQMRASRDNERSRREEMERTVQSVNGANPTHVAIGVRMVQDLQRDPVGTLRKLLTEAVAAGHTIEGIGQGIDTAAITRLIESRLPSSTTASTTNNDADIDKEISTFYGQYPDARVHDETLARVLSDQPQLTLTEAMFELKSQFAQRGLDWNKSISDPANQAVLRPSGGQDNNQQQQQKKPMLNGRQGNAPKPADHIAVAHESTSTDDIVRAAMREAGIGS